MEKDFSYDEEKEFASSNDEEFFEESPSYHETEVQNPLLMSDREDFLLQIESLVSDLIETRGLEKIYSIEYLIKSNWDVEEVKKKLDSGRLEYPIEPISNLTYEVCLICSRTLEIPVTLKCYHKFCSKCLKDYILAHCSDNACELLPRCPFSNCKTLISEKFLKMIMEKDYSIFENLFIQSFVGKCKNVRKCRNEDCGKCFFVADESLKEFECECKTEICNKCGFISHRPLSCDGFLYILKKVDMFPCEFVKVCPDCSVPLNMMSVENIVKCDCGYRVCKKCLRPPHFDSCSEIYDLDYKIDFIFKEADERPFDLHDNLKIAIHKYSLFYEYYKDAKKNLFCGLSEENMNLIIKHKIDKIVIGAILRLTWMSANLGLLFVEPRIRFLNFEINNLKERTWKLIKRIKGVISDSFIDSYMFGFNIKTILHDLYDFQIFVDNVIVSIEKGDLADIHDFSFVS